MSQASARILSATRIDWSRSFARESATAAAYDDSGTIADHRFTRTKRSQTSTRTEKVTLYVDFH